MPALSLCAFLFLKGKMVVILKVLSRAWSWAWNVAFFKTLFTRYVRRRANQRWHNIRTAMTLRKFNTIVRPGSHIWMELWILLWITDKRHLIHVLLYKYLSHNNKLLNPWLQLQFCIQLADFPCIQMGRHDMVAFAVVIPKPSVACGMVQRHHSPAC